MSSISISHPTKKIIGKIRIPGSKSESNRVLVLKQLYFSELQLSDLSDSRDTQVVQAAFSGEGPEVNVGDAGTAMRFLTAYFSVKEGRESILRGTPRMHRRPIGILVEALKKLGAEIEYLETEGFPPLKIKGKNLEGGEVVIDGSVSSQFISALMMIGPGLERGLKLKLKGLSVSAPYVYLTANLMRRLGFDVRVSADLVEVEPSIPKSIPNFAVEPDWSAASYWFLMALLAEKAEIYLPGFRQYSLQGDAFVSNIFDPIGVESHFIGSGFRLKKGVQKQEAFSINLIHNPDLAQTLAVAFAAKNIPARITGLQTLKVKETDRLAALKRELEKTGAEIEIGDDFLEVKKGIQKLEGITFDTYEDHRMAMSFAPLALLGNIKISDPGVVAKSYQSFWEDMGKVGFKIM